MCRSQSRLKILALEYASQGVRAKLDNLLRCKSIQPLAVVADFGFFRVRVEDFEHLLEIRLSVGIDLVARKRRSRFGLASGIAHHGSEVANQENGGVAQILKMLELADYDGVP